MTLSPGTSSPLPPQLPPGRPASWTRWRPWRRAGTAAVLGTALVAGMLVATPSQAAVPDPAPAPTVAQVAALGAATALAPPVGEGRFDVLVFSKTAGFRHDSIPAGVAAIEALGTANDFSVTATEDAAVFSEAGLAPYEVVLWLSTTGDVLNDEQQTAFESYVRAGGGYAGVHAASDTEYGWEFYGDLVGAYFQSHPQNQTATVVVEDPAHPSTEALPVQWSRFDEWYSFRTNPRTDVHVLASLDERSYSPGAGAMGVDHPIAWCSTMDAGRSWYTGMGHTTESFTEPGFVDHLLGGIETAAGAVAADCGATSEDSFAKVALDENTSNPMELDVADDGRVLYLERNGQVRLIETSGTVRTLITLNPYTGQESGMLGIALDPDFTENRHVFIMHSPNPADADVDRLSRFTVSADGLSIDPASEVVVLDVPVQRETCCHAGGALEFDSQGNLFLTTGDNTNPFESQGYTPIDERPGRAAFDAQRSSANTNSLSGKLLRITPQADGTYTVPGGNLFAPGTALTRPEIYGMGFRNPFRIGIDPETDNLMLADYGPDAGGASAARGPEGRVEWQVISRPGNYGWPYCHADNAAYVDWDYASNTGRGLFDCDNPVNESPNNTGLTELPPAIGAQVWYGNQPQSAWPVFGTGGAAMAGAVYRYDEDLVSDRKWPEYFDGKPLLGEWGQGRLYSVLLDEAADEPVKVDRFLPQNLFRKPMAWDYGPDGALYMIDWGSGFGGNNADSGVYRVDYVAGSRSPVARASADVTSGPVPLTVTFSSAGSVDPDGTDITVAWDFDGDGDVDSTEASPTWTYTAPGAYQALLRVTDADGLEGTTTVNVAAGNTRPVVEVTGPPEGGFTEFGDTVPYSVRVSDPEDEAGAGIDCQQVVLKPALGHDDHGHPGEQYRGCEGEFVSTIDDSHGPEADIFVVVEADYTDRGGPGGAPALTGSDLITLQPKLKQAEYFTDSGRTSDSTGGGDPGVQLETTGDPRGGFQNIGYVEDGDYVAYDPVNLTGIDGVGARVASAGGGGLLEVRWNAPDGPVLGTLDIPGTGGWQTYIDVRTDLVDELPEETGTLYLVAQHRSSGAESVFNVNWLQFEGTGVSFNSAPVVAAVSATPDAGTAPLPVRLSATVTDPDGDAVTGRWTTGIAGDAPRDGTEVDVVYTAPGSYTATFTATDARGAFRTATVTVTVSSPPLQPCVGGRSDDFSGDALDTDRWQVVRPDGNLRVADGSLVLQTTATDIYGTNNTGTPNLVLQELPDGPFVATTKLSMTARTQYQQAGLLLYGDDDNYAKLVLQARAGTASPDAANRIFQYIREVDGVPNEVGESNTATLGAAYPDTVYVRLSSTTGEDLTASYSADGATWTPMPQTMSITDIENPRIGLFALSGSGARPVTDAAFDLFTITPDDTAEALDPADSFDGAVLDDCRWEVVRPEPDALTVADGELTLRTGSGDIYGTGNSGPTNFVLQQAPAGDWSFETRLNTSLLDEQYQQAGLIAYVDDANYVKLDQLTTNAAGSPVVSAVEMRGEVADVVQGTQPQANDVPVGDIWLRLAKTGSTFTGAYSLDGTTWVETGGITPLRIDNAVVAGSPGLKVGVFTLGAAQTERTTVSFDLFRPSGDDEPEQDTTAPQVRAAVDPEAPASGWWSEPVTVSLTATDDSQADGGVVHTEYRIDEGEWLEHTAALVLDPATLGDGTHSLQHRASDSSGNTSEVGSVEVRFDTTGPEVEAGVADGGALGDSVELDLGATATDELSGVASVALELDGEPVEAGTIALHTLELGEHLLGVVATDVAGNVTEVEVRFTVTTSLADMDVLLQRFAEEGRVAPAVLAQLAQRLDQALAAQAQGARGEQRLRAALRSFDTLVSRRVGDDEVARVLLRDSAYVVEQVRGG